MVLAASAVSLPRGFLSKAYDSSRQDHAERAGQRAAAKAQLKPSNCSKPPKKSRNGARGQMNKGDKGSMSRQVRRRGQK